MTQPPETNGRPSDPKTAKFHKLLYEDEMIDLNQLKLIAWGGIPFKYRPLSWRLLIGYLPVAKSKREQQLKRKRDEYDRLIEQYYNDRLLDDGMWRQIHIDIPRMQPLIPIFQQPRVQESFERILYIWSIRHPASGYVQGMNDLVTPFFLTYLSEFSNSQSQQLQDVENFDISLIDDTQLRNIEADTYWSFGKLLDSIQNNYTHAQPGIQRLIKMLATVISRVDSDLHNHLKNNGVDYLQFAFRWMNNLLIRELPLRLVVRLWDSYLAEGFLATFTPTAAMQANASSISSNQSTTTAYQNLLTSSSSAASHQHLNNHQHGSNISLTSKSGSNDHHMLSSNNHFEGFPTRPNNNAGAIIPANNSLPTSATTTSNASTNHHSNKISSSTWNNGSETPFSASFHLFVCAAFLKSWSKHLLREQDFQGIMLLLQNLPTYHWSDQEIVMMLADAYHLKETFSPSHLRI
uniref:TBC1 domain family member 22B n=1 Tax=Aceria tosichella TaxID=561515 RepID=A0A6G1SP54_9ACAR